MEKKTELKAKKSRRYEKKKLICPKCNMPYVRRVSSGVWQCKKCGTKFAGQAYNPRVV